MSDSRSITPGFFAIHANHLEDLRRAVVYLCQQNPMPPLQQETFLVQSNGIAQWLKLALAEQSQAGGAGGLGIAASMEFLFPARFIWQAYRAVLADGEVPEQSPFDKRRLLWRLYRLLPQLVQSDDVFAPLARFLQGHDADERVFQLAEKIADLFDQYQVFRADWLAAWEQGDDIVINARGERKLLPVESCWQPQLWRCLLDDVGSERSSRAHIHTRFMQQGTVAAQPANPQRLPKRIVVFGVSSLPRQALEALSVLSRFSQVVLCVHNPCQYFWADIISDRELLTASRRRGKLHPVLSTIDDPDTLHQYANPLLAAWGKQGRDYIRLLDEFDDPASYSFALPTPEQKIDIFSDHGQLGCQNLLHQLQNDILHLVPVNDIAQQQRVVDVKKDRSLSFQQAHSALREVEILHDQLLAAFNADASLRPRDIMVMVPDINVYAPHIQAVFGRHDRTDLRFIPFTISDQGQRHQSPVFIALETLLSLPRSRFASSDILSLLEVPSLRARFGISDDELPLARRWVQGANIRWGLHAKQRHSLELPEGLTRNTWQVGMRRMLLGYGLGGDVAWNGVEPYAEVAGLQASLAGRLDAFVRQLQWLWQRLQQSHSAEQWHALLAAMLDDFFDQAESDDIWLLNRFRRQLETWLEDCQAALLTQPLPLDIVRDAVMDGLDEAGLNQRFLAGKVNFATLMPMRAIPFRRICLLGMNDGDYPRSRPPVDFDLMADDYRPGDRSRREDDRYLFLEAMLSARDHLYISWVGRSIRDDSERPPSVLVSQLQDHLNLLWRCSDDDTQSVCQRLTRVHPLQPFSREYFPNAEDKSATAAALFTYEQEWRAAHEGAISPPSREPLAFRPPQEPLTLVDLAQFLKSPIETFYQRRLQVQFADELQMDLDHETFAFDGLTRWRLDQELIEQVVKRCESEEEFDAALKQQLLRMAQRGELGMGINEQLLTTALAGRMPDLFRRYIKAKYSWPQAVESQSFYTDMCGHSDVQVADWLADIRVNDQGHYCRLVVAQSSLLSGSGAQRKVRYRNLIKDWLYHLAGQLSDQPFETLIIAKEEGREFHFPRLSVDVSQTCLQAILQLWCHGRCQPLALHCEAAFAWIQSFYKSKKYQGDELQAKQAALAVLELAWQRDLGYLRSAYSQPEQLFDHDFTVMLKAIYLPLWQAEQGEPVIAPDFSELKDCL